jgi:LuxR family quorum sensing-dependent transcriptional regulator
MLQESVTGSLSRINALINTLQPCAQIMTQAHSALLEVSGMLGFNTFTYMGGRLLAGHKITGWKVDSAPLSLTNVQPEFKHVYSTERLDADDPVLKYCFHTLYPKEWSRILSLQTFSRREQKFIGLSADFSMHDGLAFPVHGPGNDYGILSFSSHQHVSVPDITLVAMVNLFAQKLHACIRENFDHYLQKSTAKLAAREIDILYWCGEGKTAWEIGQILGISERTVETHIQNAKKKLDAVNTVQAIAKAMTIRFSEPV